MKAFKVKWINVTWLKSSKDYLCRSSTMHYWGFIYDRPNNESFKDKIENI